MNKKQKIVLWIGLVLFMLMGIFPPWYYVYKSEISADISYKSGYYCLFVPPHSYKKEYRIDKTRLHIQWTIVVVVAVCLILTLKDIKKREEK
ncbi:MAG: hypothetical protein HQ568_08000 [Calditrichaeota bacterium]|nr:hypothetical protein [Calditrichota bacterium]